MTGIRERVGGFAARTLVLNFAAMVFLGVTLFLTWQADNWGAMTSGRGLLFVLVGVILAGVVAGALPAYLHRRIATSLIHRNNGQVDERVAGIIRSSGTVVLLFQLLIVYYATQWAYLRWFVMK